ncbi:hypothetical protein P9869_22295 [Streptomyces ossamyceticus]|nr:hypothetical protein [Streptomyces ossamyceticus]
MPSQHPDRPDHQSVLGGDARQRRVDGPWEEREINRIIDERMANPAPGIPIEDIMRETLARSE